MTGADQAGCVHQWALTEVILGTGAELVDECTRCGAVAFTGSQQDRRMPLPAPPPDPS